jgi:PAS domain S-box-containing protein
MLAETDTLTGDGLLPALSLPVAAVFVDRAVAYTSPGLPGCDPVSGCVAGRAVCRRATLSRVIAMPMRAKLIAILALIAAAMFVADGAIERAVVYPKFAALERAAAGRNLMRVEQALGREAEQLAASARNYGEWDDAYRFIRDRNPEFLRTNLGPEVFATLKINLARLYDDRGSLVWEQTRDAVRGAPLAIAGLPSAAFAPDGVLLRHGAAPQARSGLLTVGDGLMIVASYPIVTSRGEGPVRGTVVFGRLLDETELARLHEQVNVDCALVPYDAEFLADKPELSADDDAPRWYDDSRHNVLQVYATLNDLHGEPVRALQVDYLRLITLEGREAIWYEQGWMLLAAVGLVTGAYVCLGYFVVRPVRQLIRHVQWIRQCGDLSKRIGRHGADEVGTLAAEFDLLLAQLARSRAMRLRSENRLRGVLEEQTELIRRFLPDGTLTFVNRAYAKYFGKPEESLIGHREQLDIPAEDRPQVAAHLQVLSAACPETAVEHRVVLADGAVRRLYWTTRAVFDGQGNVVELQSVGREVDDEAVDAKVLDAEVVAELRTLTAG